MDAVRLSKLLAFVLRHRPDTLGVELDGQGWTPTERLVERLNASGRLEAPLDRPGFERFVRGEGSSRFELDGAAARVRARRGHTAPGISATRPLPVAPPDFLFFGAPRDRIARHLSGSGLTAEPGRFLALHESERAARRAALAAGRGRARVVVIEAQRAARAGVAFLHAGEAGIVLAAQVPRRFLLSERPGFERQVSAGAVLVRHVEGDVQIALIRTRPRGEAEAEGDPAPEDEAIDLSISHDPDGPPPPPAAPVAVRAPASPPGSGPSPAALPAALPPRADERRTGADRRQADLGPPGGVERRQGTHRRRRRRGGWGPEGRVELPKGKLEAGETAFAAAVRELREETGLVTPVDLVRELPRVRYTFRTPEGKSVYKVVHYFLLVSRDPSPVFVPQGKEGIVAVEWTSLFSALESIAFGNLRPVLEAARDALAPGAPPPPPLTVETDEETGG